MITGCRWHLIISLNKRRGSTFWSWAVVETLQPWRWASKVFSGWNDDTCKPSDGNPCWWMNPGKRKGVHDEIEIVRPFPVIWNRLTKNWTKAGGYPAPKGRTTIWPFWYFRPNFHAPAVFQEKSCEFAKDVCTCFIDLERKHMTGSVEKNFGVCCVSTV